jgi:Peptidase C13 family
MNGFWNKVLFISVCILISGPAYADSVQSYQSAYDIAIDSACEGQAEGLSVYASKVPFQTGTEIKTWKGTFLKLESDTWLVFIDDMPGANWEHPCRYALVDPDTGDVRVIDGTRPPECLNTMIHMSGPDIIGGKNVRPVGVTPRNPVEDGRSVDHLWAVILSGGASSGSNHVRYWNDCSSIYKTLVEIYGYLDENIIVAISDGTDPAPDQSNGGNSDPDLDGDGDDDIMYSCTNANLAIIFADLATNLGSQDSLFIFTTDHGSGQSGVPGQPTSMNLWNGEEIWDYEFAALMEPIQCREFNVVMEPCFSGGFVNDIIEMNSTVPRTISTAANDHEYSWAMPPDYIYDTYVFHWTAAVRGEDAYGVPVDADTNGDDIVDMHEAYIYAEYMDQDDEHPQYDDFPDGYGDTTSLWGSGPTSEGDVKLDRAYYSCDDIITIVVEDLDLAAQGTVNITVDSTTEPTGETVTLTEGEEGHFEGTISTAEGSPSADGILQIVHADTITATYDDEDFGGQGPMTVIDTATADCEPPVISNVASGGLTYQSAVITWTTDEPSTSRVEYGLNMGLGSIEESDELVMDHSVELGGLDDCTTYYFKVVSADEAQNEAEDDNGGALYTFQTWEIIYLVNEPMDTDPGWDISGGQWAFGQPTGGGGSYGNPDPTSGYTGDNVIGYNLNGDYPNNMSAYYVTTGAFDCSDVSGISLGFYRWLGVESNSWDHAVISVSNDNGGTWSDIWENPGSSLSDGSWTYEEYDISSIAEGYENVKVRWQMGTSDTSVIYCGWNIDDVIVYCSHPCGEPSPTPPPTYTPTIAPTETPAPPTDTPVPPTETPVPPTDTPVPPTDTPVQPTDTPIPPTNTPVPPTETPVPPTDTPVLPTDTPVPPTDTPVPPTNTPVPPTETPIPPTETPVVPDKGMELILTDTDLVEGDMFHLYFHLHNPESTGYGCDAYLLLGIYGSYWCWPSWDSIYDNLDSKLFTVPGNESVTEEVLEFTWPGNVGSAADLEFIGCIFEPGSWDMIGDAQYILWGYN